MQTQESKHTAGEWTTDGHSVGVPRGTVCTMYRPGDASGRGLTQSEQEANAALIAAAPDLLAALEKIDANAAESVEWIRNVARSAIAKARPGAGKVGGGE